jgi:hypothetical protein
VCGPQCAFSFGQNQMSWLEAAKSIVILQVQAGQLESQEVTEIPGQQTGS